MYNQDKLINILKTSIGEKSLNEFARTSGVDAAYISRIINKVRTTPPSPKILERIANASHGIADYQELMQICGYTEQTLESNVSSIYNKIKEYHKYINNGKNDDDNFYEIEGFIENFQQYLYILEQNIVKKSKKPIFLEDIFDFAHVIENYKYIAGFILLYNEFLQLLQLEDYIDIINYTFIDCLNIDNIYNNLYTFEVLELLSLHSKNIVLKSFDNEFIKYINNFSHCLSLAHLKEFDNNTLIELFKKKSQNDTFNNNYIDDNNNPQYYMCPVYRSNFSWAT
ncbi:MAG: helix-turn-helix transcriptional regulator [Clostridia bacterium]|jgi:transcriptional regulator with XRE-family HTH domain|nr:helix-turn-helix transcriptional regulator [Clostridia bacterium]